MVLCCGRGTELSNYCFMKNTAVTFVTSFPSPTSTQSSLVPLPCVKCQYYSMYKPCWYFYYSCGHWCSAIPIGFLTPYLDQPAALTLLTLKTAPTSPTSFLQFLCHRLNAGALQSSDFCPLFTWDLQAICPILRLQLPCFCGEVFEVTSLPRPLPRLPGLMEPSAYQKCHLDGLLQAQAKAVRLLLPPQPFFQLSLLSYPSQKQQARSGPEHGLHPQCLPHSVLTHRSGLQVTFARVLLSSLSSSLLLKKF